MRHRRLWLHVFPQSPSLLWTSAGGKLWVAWLADRVCREYDERSRAWRYAAKRAPAAASLRRGAGASRRATAGWARGIGDRFCFDAVSTAIAEAGAEDATLTLVKKILDDAAAKPRDLSKHKLVERGGRRFAGADPGNNGAAPRAVAGAAAAAVEGSSSEDDDGDD